MSNATFCNPLPLPALRPCLPFTGLCRAGAEPCMVYDRGSYYLFTSHNGVFTSTDFETWKHHRLEFLCGAWGQPNAGPNHICKVGDHFLLTCNNVTPDNTAVPLYSAASPLGPWQALGDMRLPDGSLLKDLKRPLNVMFYYDAKLLYDRDGRLYTFWGCSPTGGIWGAELDPANPVQMLTEPKLLFRFDPKHHWEWHGSCNENPCKGWVEGCFPFRHGDRYYLLYCAAGVQYASYATGYYTAESPLGPYSYAEENPIFNCPSGMAPGGGHASLFAGANGSHWLLYSVAWNGSHKFERRTAVMPAWFDEAGKLYVAKNGCDLPQFVPGTVAAPQENNGAGLIQVNLLKPPTAVSSCAEGSAPVLAVAGEPRSWWQPAAGDETPWLEQSLDGVFPVLALRLCWKEPHYNAAEGIVPDRPVRYVVEYAECGKSAEWKTLVDASNETCDLTIDYRTFPEVCAAKVRIRILDWSRKTGIGILDFALFGKACVADPSFRECMGED